MAVWTTEHDPKCKKRVKASSDTPAFSQTELRRYPIIVVTHKFYLGNNGRNALAIVHGRQSGQRALTIVDEQPAEVEPIEILLPEAQHVREVMQEAHPEYKLMLGPCVAPVRANVALASAVSPRADLAVPKLCQQGFLRVLAEVRGLQ